MAKRARTPIPKTSKRGVRAMRGWVPTEPRGGYRHEDRNPYNNRPSRPIDWRHSGRSCRRLVRIDDYRLPRSWKTHFYFHGTTGTLSPSSILRVGEDPRTKLRCHVYAVYPVENYHKLGGRQVP